MTEAEKIIAPKEKKTVPLETPLKKTTSVKKTKTPKAIVPEPEAEPNLLSKAWRKLDDWHVGLSGKVILILIIVGFITKMLEKL